jgi:phosphoribosylglycinamide formyltransferase-1
MPNICILTFDAPHLKTEQVAMGLFLAGYRDVALAALPFKYRAPRSPLFNHRPAQELGAHPADVARYCGYPFSRIERDIDMPPGFDYYLVGGAGLFSSEAVQGRKVVNCHPGAIPAVRGLDAFKWAVLDDQPLAVTLHLVDAEVDAGEVLSVVRTPVFPGDDLAILARRHYEIEIEMTINFERYIKQARTDLRNVAERPARMRMPEADERRMLDCATDYVARHGNHA